MIFNKNYQFLRIIETRINYKLNHEFYLSNNSFFLISKYLPMFDTFNSASSLPIYLYMYLIVYYDK